MRWSFIKEKQDWDDGRAVYDIEFVVAVQNSVYDYEVDASTGAVLSKSVESIQAGELPVLMEHCSVWMK